MAYHIMNFYGKDCIGLKEIVCGFNNEDGNVVNKIKNVDITYIMENTNTNVYLELNNILDFID